MQSSNRTCRHGVGHLRYVNGVLSLEENGERERRRIE
jgi:hypothetical protein